MRRQGPPLLQAYLDLAKLLRKESVIAESASWLFRSAPYLIFALTWVAAALVPSFASGLMFNWAADVVALVAAAGGGPRPAGAGRHGCRHQLRRHRLVARDDDRHLGRARHDADRADAGHRRRHHAAGRCRRLLHRRAVWRARVARPVAHLAGHRGAGRECAHPGRQPGDASGAHHGPRGHGAGIFRTPPGPDRGGESPQAGALPFPADLPVRAVRHGAGRRRACPAGRSASRPGSPSCWPALSLLGVWEVSIAKMRVFRLPDFVGIAFVFGFIAILLAFLTRGVFA